MQIANKEKGFFYSEGTGTPIVSSKGGVDDLRTMTATSPEGRARLKLNADGTVSVLKETKDRGPKGHGALLEDYAERMREFGRRGLCANARCQNRKRHCSRYCQACSDAHRAQAVCSARYEAVRNGGNAARVTAEAAEDIKSGDLVTIGEDGKFRKARNGTSRATFTVTGRV